MGVGNDANRKIGFITNPGRFASSFNERFPGAYRLITAEDVICMTKCKLICRYGFYARDDLETIRNIIEYEQMRKQRSTQQGRQEPLSCKMCGQPLPLEPETKTGRPREYCVGCDSLRDRERQKRLRRKRRKHRKPVIT